MKTLAKLVLILGVVMAFSTCALANTIPNVEFGFIDFGPPLVYNGSGPSDLLSATYVVLPSTEVVNETTTPFDGKLNLFSSLAGPPLNLGTPLLLTFPFTPVTLSTDTLYINFTGTLPAITFASEDGHTFSFTPSTAPGDQAMTRGPSAGGGEELTLYYLGLFKDTTKPSPFYDNGSGGSGTLASLDFLFQESSGGSLNFSGLFEDPPAPPIVPEPATMSLIGSSLIGLAFFCRRRKG